MLNNNNKILNNINLNSYPTGIIQKTQENSFFLKMHYSSERANELFREIPIYRINNCDNGYVVNILQIMNIGDGYIIVELQKKEIK